MRPASIPPTLIRPTTEPESDNKDQDSPGKAEAKRRDHQRRAPCHANAKPRQRRQHASQKNHARPIVRPIVCLIRFSCNSGISCANDPATWSRPPCRITNRVLRSGTRPTETTFIDHAPEARPRDQEREGARPTLVSLVSFRTDYWTKSETRTRQPGSLLLDQPEARMILEAMAREENKKRPASRPFDGAWVVARGLLRSGSEVLAVPCFSRVSACPE